MEPASGNEPIPANEGPPLRPPVGIRVVSYRSRICDTDGVSAKAAIDGIVRCGLLPDDSCKEIAWVRFEVRKVKNESEEKTLIYLEEIRDGSH